MSMYPSHQHASVLTCMSWSMMLWGSGWISCLDCRWDIRLGSFSLWNGDAAPQDKAPPRCHSFISKLWKVSFGVATSRFHKKVLSEWHSVNWRRSYPKEFKGNIMVWSNKQNAWPLTWDAWHILALVYRDRLGFAMYRSACLTEFNWCFKEAHPNRKRHLWHREYMKVIRSNRFQIFKSPFGISGDSPC